MIVLSKELIRAARAMMPNAQCSTIAPGGSSRKVTVADVCDSHEALRSALDAARETLRRIQDEVEKILLCRDRACEETGIAIVGIHGMLHDAIAGVVPPAFVVQGKADEVHITRANLLSEIVQIEQKTGRKVLTDAERASVQPPHGTYDPPGIDSDHERFMATRPALAEEVERLSDVVAEVLFERKAGYTAEDCRAVARAVLRTSSTTKRTKD